MSPRAKTASCNKHGCARYRAMKRPETGSGVEPRYFKNIVPTDNEAVGTFFIPEKVRALKMEIQSLKKGEQIC